MTRVGSLEWIHHLAKFLGRFCRFLRRIRLFGGEICATKVVDHIPIPPTVYRNVSANIARP